ncbi:WIAG-tail domain [Paenibacillus piri]|uniref:WIAG-tail domain n=1 Tax=Paenibacillus piri TaxID=2547395 RepID=A0A4R5KPE8_9BACL|nr:WIAG-tail domain [Paenibacillus piri]TDF97551.1 WIAG-tail domain [Paenibacillus piri]
MNKQSGRSKRTPFRGKRIGTYVNELKWLDEAPARTKTKTKSAASPSKAIVHAQLLEEAKEKTAPAIPAGAVKSEHIAAGAVNGEHLVNDSIDGLHVRQESLSGYHLLPGSITLLHLDRGLQARLQTARALMTSAHTQLSITAQQYGLSMFKMSFEDENIYLTVTFEQPFADEEYVLVATTDHETCFAVVEEKRRDSATIRIVRTKFTSELRGNVNWIAIGVLAP